MEMNNRSLTYCLYIVTKFSHLLSMIIYRQRKGLRFSFSKRSTSVDTISYMHNNRQLNLAIPLPKYIIATIQGQTIKKVSTALRFSDDESYLASTPNDPVHRPASDSLSNIDRLSSYVASADEFIMFGSLLHCIDISIA